MNQTENNLLICYGPNDYYSQLRESTYIAIKQEILKAL